jgi:hypothetical protein
VRTYGSDGASTPLYEDTTQLFFDDAINDAVIANVYPYNERGNRRDTYNDADSLFTPDNLISLTGNITDGFTSSTIELNIPFSAAAASRAIASVRSIPDDDDDDRHVE